MLARRRARDGMSAEWRMQRTLRDEGLLPDWRMPVNWAFRNGFRLLPLWALRGAYRAVFLRRPTR